MRSPLWKLPTQTRQRAHKQLLTTSPSTPRPPPRQQVLGSRAEVGWHAELALNDLLAQLLLVARGGVEGQVAGQARKQHHAQRPHVLARQRHVSVQKRQADASGLRDLQPVVFQTNSALATYKYVQSQADAQGSFMASCVPGRQCTKAHGQIAARSAPHRCAEHGQMYGLDNKMKLKQCSHWECDDCCRILGDKCWAGSGGFTNKILEDKTACT
eukprot:483569-Pelagomonas_calceolata.AAC.9